MATSTPTATADRPKTSSKEGKVETRKRINGRFLLIVSVMFLVAGIGLYLLHSVQVERNSVTLKDRAEAAEKEGDYAQAVGLYSQYLTFQQDDFDTLLHFVRLRDGLATSAQALSQVLLGYEEVLRRDEGRSDEAEIRLDAAAVAIVIQQYATALGHLDKLLKDPAFKEWREEEPAIFANLYFQIGQCHEGEGRTAEAFEAYKQAIKFDHDEPKFYLAIAQLVAKSPLDVPGDEFADLSEQQIEDLPVTKKISRIVSRIDQKDFPAGQAADEILGLMVDQAKAPANAYLARAQFNYGRVRLDDARRDIDQAVDLDPTNVETRLSAGQLAVDQARIARLLFRFTNYSRHLASARRAVETGQELAQDDARFHRLQALIEDETREGAHLLPAVAEKTEPVEPGIAGIQSPLGKIHWKHYDAAEKALTKGIEVAAESIEAAKKQQPVRIRLRMQDPNPKPSLLQLAELNNQLNWALADTLISKHQLLAAESSNELSKTDDRLEKAREQIEILEKARASRGLIDFLNARLLMVAKDWSEAAWQLEQTRTRLTGNADIEKRIVLLLLECYGQMGNPDKQLVLLADEKLQDWAPAIALLPGLYLRANRPTDALRAYERIGENPRASLEIARIHFGIEQMKPPADRDFRRVYQLLDEANLRTSEQFSDRALLRAEALVLEANQLDAKRQSVEALGKYEAAVSELDEALKQWPREAELWEARARLELAPYPKIRTSAARAAAAKQILKRAKEEIGDALPLRLAAVQIAIVSPLDAAEKEVQALEKPALSDAEQSQLLRALARASLSLKTRDLSNEGKHEQRALDYFERAAELQPNRAEPQISLAELASELKKTAPIEKAIERVTALEGPKGPNGSYLKILKIIAEAGSITKLSAGDQERVRELLRQARRDRSSWAVLARIEGDLEWELGQKAEAVRRYEEAIRLGDRSQASLLMYDRITEFYLNNLRRAEAREFLRRVELSTPVQFSGDAGIDWETRLGATYLGQIFLSQWRAERGESGGRVLEPLEKAKDLAPEKPEPYLALVNYYVAANNREKARGIIDEAAENLEKTPPHLAPLALARCYDKLGDRTAAEQKYSEARESANDEDKATIDLALAGFYSRSPASDPEKREQDWQKAHDLIDKLLQANPAGDIQNLAVALKINLWLGTGRFEDSEKAIRLWEKYAKDDSASDLATKAQILLVRNRYQDRMELIGVLEKLESKNRLETKQKLLLARLYQQADNWPAAEERYQEILRLDEKNSQVLAAYIQGLIAQKELEEAERRLTELKSQQTNSFTLAILEATLLQAKGEQPAAVAMILDGAANLEEVDSPDQAVTDLALEGKLNEAVEDLEKLARESGNRELLSALQRVRGLIAQNQTNKAADLLKGLLAATRLPFAVQILQLKAAVRLLDGWGELKAAETIVRKIVERSDQPDDVLMLISNLARQDRIDESLALCQKAWENCDPAKVGGMCVGILRTGNASAVEIAQAEKELTAGMKRHPDLPELKIALADLRDFQTRYDEAEDIYKDILKDKGSSSAHLTALNNLAWLMAMRGNNAAKAEELIELAVSEAEKRVGPVPQLLDTRAAIYLKLKKRDKALSDLTRALNVSKKPDPLLYFHLAQAQLAIGDKAAAIKSFEKSKSLKASDFHPLERETYEEVAAALMRP